MSKKEFMEELQMLLGELPQEEREEAIRYYESYFEEAGEDQEQAVLEELGSARRVAEQILRDYRAENQESQERSTSESGITITNKGLSGGALVVAILIAIITFPIWISILATAFGLLMGLFGACIGIVVGFGAGGIGCIIGGVAAFAVGIVKAFTIPLVGAALIAIGLLVFGVGCLMIAAVGGIIRLAVWVVNELIKLFGRLFHGRKGVMA